MAPLRLFRNYGENPSKRPHCQKNAGTRLKPRSVGQNESTPERIRTSNLRFRRPMLYPVELRVLMQGLNDTEKRPAVKSSLPHLSKNTPSLSEDASVF